MNEQIKLNTRQGEKWSEVNFVIDLIFLVDLEHVLQSDIIQTERENQLEKLEAAKAAWLVCLSLLSLTGSFLVLLG